MEQHFIVRFGDKVFSSRSTSALGAFVWVVLLCSCCAAWGACIRAVCL